MRVPVLGTGGSPVLPVVKGAVMKRVISWMKTRMGEASTWAGLGMIAVVLGSDPGQTAGIVQAITLILGGGLVAAGPVPDTVGRASAGTGL